MKIITFRIKEAPLVLYYKMKYLLLKTLFILFKFWNRIISNNDKVIKEKEWSAIHQKFEFLYHIRENIRWNDVEFYRQWEKIFREFLELLPSSFDSTQVILDLGCGSRPAFDWFTTSKAKKIYLDPLLSSYLTIPQVRPYWKDKDDNYLLSSPAEIINPEMIGACDFVLCWNVLDHTFDWNAIMHNIVRYAREGSLVCIGTDFTSHGIGHPGIDNKSQYYEILNRYFIIERESMNYVNREIAFKLIRNSVSLTN